MNKNLMREAGLSEGGFISYKNLSVDNGTDIAGTGATGEFVELSYNEETKEKNKKSYGLKFEGVLLLSRAFLTYRDNKLQKKIWETEEFNPLLTRDQDGGDALIPIYQLDLEGKRQKDDDGKFIVNYSFYDELSARKKAGEKGMDYTYTIVLYILAFFDGKKEIIKLKFKGASRGNFFKYQQNLWKDYKASSTAVVTSFSTYLEASYNKFAISFKPTLGEDGQPVKYNDPAEIENNIVMLVERAKGKRAVLTAPVNQESLNISSDEGVESLEAKGLIQKGMPTVEPVEVPESNSIDDQLIEAQEEDSNEIKIEDIPIN